MPISSGALEWPKSYFHKPESVAKADDIKLSARGDTPRDYEWQLQLSSRENYEKWRKEKDRKDLYKRGKKNKNTCCPCCSCCPCANKSKTKVRSLDENIADGHKRKKPRDAIKLRRRWYCCCLALWLSLLFLVFMILFIFFFLHFTGTESLRPEQDVFCAGKLGVHWLFYNCTSCGPPGFGCCYLADFQHPNAVNTTLQNKGSSGQVVYNNGSCRSQYTSTYYTLETCERYRSQQSHFHFDVPNQPCSSFPCRQSPPSLMFVGVSLVMVRFGN